MAKTVDVVMLRERRKRRRMLVKLAIFLLVVILGAMIYASRDTWFAKLEQIGSKPSTVSTENSEFMLTVTGGVEYYADFVNTDLFVLCDKYLYIYAADGELKDSRQHAYSNAVMKTNNTIALTYSCNGTSFRVDTQKKMLYENQTEQAIWFAALSDTGYVAVVTESETYACRLHIFDASGKLIYARDCIERLVDVSFQGNGCICGIIGAENGELVTTLQYIEFDDSETKWTTESLATLCLHVYALDDGGAFVIGDTKAAYYSADGVLVGSYAYNGTLTDFDFEDGQAAVLLRNEERRQSVLLLFAKQTWTPVTISFDSICKSVMLEDGSAYLLDSGIIRNYAFSGTELSSFEIKNVYDGVLKKGKYFYLLGYDRIQRVSE